MQPGASITFGPSDRRRCGGSDLTARILLSLAVLGMLYPTPKSLAKHSREHISVSTFLFEEMLLVCGMHDANL
jgi:hypothetical protein